MLAEARIQDGPQRQQFVESSPSLSEDTGEGIRTIKTKGTTSSKQRLERNGHFGDFVDMGRLMAS